jgi:hypothetical protein
MALLFGKGSLRLKFFDQCLIGMFAWQDLNFEVQVLRLAASQDEPILITT